MCADSVRNAADMSKTEVVIVGAGITGMYAAWKLAEDDGYHVTLIEARDRLGGMSSWDTIGDYYCDRYYHVLLSRDTETLNLVSELGLSDSLFWKTTKSGFFGRGRLVSLSSAFDFLSFPFLTFLQKIRLAFGIIFTSRISNAEKLEKQYVRAWLTRVFGRRVYERIWDPLLRSKLGNGREETSAAFMWATIRRLYGARSDSASRQEKMGHLEGGYRRILESWERQLTDKGVILRKDEPVVKVNSAEKNVLTHKAHYSYDKLLITTASAVALEILSHEFPAGPYRTFMEGQKYLGVVCIRLLLKRSLSPYYVINLLDESLPFTGIIESTHVIGTDQLGGFHLAYLPHYSVEEEDFSDMDQEKITSEYLEALMKVFPDLTMEDIVSSSLSFERYVQPLYTLDYGNRIPSFATPVQDVFLANTSMIRNAVLNNNAAIELSSAAVQALKEG